MSVAVIIPFRNRTNGDPRRSANLEVVHAWWYAHGYEPQIVSDGLSGDAPFNRHRAYNLAVSGNPETDVFVFTEADMLIHPDQIRRAVDLAEARPGLVVPFTQYRYLSDETTMWIRKAYHDWPNRYYAEWIEQEQVFQIEPESTMDNGRSIGAINVMSRRTLEITGGFTEQTQGNWYDDRIIEEGFAYLTGQRTRYVEGPAVHLYHLPGHAGTHLSLVDKNATARNRSLLIRMRTDIRMRSQDRVRRLMSYREGR